MRDLMRSDDRVPLAETLEGMRREARRRLRPLALLFLFVTVAALAVGWSWPKKYHASATILVTEDKTIQKLMEGRAVPTGVVNRAMIAREVMFSRKVMDEILRLGGWLDDSPDAAERTLRAEMVQARTVIGAPRENLIRVDYWDTDPQRAQRVAQRFVDLFQYESRIAQLRESRQAYDFIAGQAERYHGVLRAAENRLSEYRRAHPEATAEPPALVEARLASLRQRIERDQDRLQQASASRPAAANPAAEPDPQRERRLALQRELAEKRLQYTDAHPEVRRLQRQLDELWAGVPSLASPPQAKVPARTGQDSAALRARIAAAERELALEQRRVQQALDPDPELSELLREHQLASDIYQDLLRRLEYARLSMTLDEQGSGLEFRTHEPASVPSRPSGVRFAHFALGGLAAATALPLGLLFLFVRFDPHLRSPQAVQRATGLPLLASIPALTHPGQRRVLRDDRRFAALLIALALAAMTAASLIKLMVAR
jgi:polysaccharide chain length determinant protein (PEP-CTERM system associated)